MIKYSILVFSFLLISCIREIEVNIPEQEHSLVIYSTIVPFTPPDVKFLNIKVRTTRNIFDTAKNYTSDALVLMYKNNKIQDTLKYIDSIHCYPINFFPAPGDKYFVQVIKKDFKTVTSETFIPAKVKIDTITINPVAYFDEDGSVFSEIAITFTDPVNENNFYELVVSDINFNYDNDANYYELTTNDNIVTSESYYPSLLRFDVKKPKYLLFNDETINGEQHTLYVYYTPPQHEQDYRFISDHFITIQLRNVTEEFYLFKTTMIQQGYSRVEDILYGMGEPLNVISNIQNGHGLFAGFNFDQVSLHIPETKLNRQ